MLRSTGEPFADVRSNLCIYGRILTCDAKRRRIVDIRVDAPTM